MTILDGNPKPLPEWRQPGTCRTVCRPPGYKRRCFKPKDVERIARYAVACGSSRSEIYDAIGCLGCQDIIDALRKIRAIRAAAEEDLQTAETILEYIATIAALVRLVPWWVRRFPGIRKLFLAIEALLAFSDIFSDAIKALIDALVDIEAVIFALAEEVCGEENSES